jgi:hypothetical protein
MRFANGSLRSHVRLARSLAMFLLLGCGNAFAPPVPPLAAHEAEGDPAQREVIEATVALPVLARGEVIRWPSAWSGSFDALESELWSEGAFGVVAEDARALVLVSEGRFVVVPPDEETPASAYANDHGFVYQCHAGRAVPLVDKAFVICGRDGSLVAIERDTLAPRWTRTAPVPNSGTVGLHASADMLIATTYEAWYGLDPRDGSTRWRRPAASAVGIDHAGFGLVVAALDEGVVGVDARTGEERFRLDPTGVATTPISAHGFAVVRHPGASPGRGPSAREVIVLALDGTVRRHFTLDADVASPNGVVVGERDLTLIVAVGGDRIEVRRYDLESGRLLHRSPAFASAFAIRAAIATFAEGTVIVSDPGTLRALEPARSSETWLGHPRRPCDTLTAWAPSPRRAPVLMCLSWGSVALYRADPSPPPRRSIVVTGSVSCAGRPRGGVRLAIGGVIAVSGEDGRYRAEATFDRELRVALAATPWLDHMVYCTHPGRRLVDLAPDTQSVVVDLELEAGAGALDGL